VTLPVIHAPEIEAGLTWLNTDRPLTLRGLRGSVVVLDFWTYCCVNCMHVAPVLRAIEERHRGEPLVIVGVHSGKFDAEHDPERVRAAVARLGIEHPVVVDEDSRVWSAFAVRSWPTLVVVRPDGTLAAIAPGEPDLEELDAFLRRELDDARARGTLAAAPPELHAPARAADGPLLYPGKASVAPDGRIAVSDSGHHRVLVLDPGGRVLHAVGSGLAGLRDGAFEDAAFDDPQGSAWLGGALYVADARSHAIRRVDLEYRVVRTVAGTGALGGASPEGRVPAREVALRSPWDLAEHRGALLVAMAGSHELWRFWPDREAIEVLAGSGVEALGDGALGESAWAQPSGLSVRGDVVYVADSETSAVRALDLARGTVRTLVGQGLIEFGDADGDAEHARLQHPLGVAAVEGGVLVADTFNGKLKRVADPATWSAPSDEPGRGVSVRTVLAGLHEPGSVAVAPDGSLVVADTNAHRLVRVVDDDATEIVVVGAPAPRRGALPAARTASGPHPAVDAWFTTILSLPEGVGLAPGVGTIALALRPHEGTKLSEGAPVRARVEVSRRSDLLVLDRDEVVVPAGGAGELVVPIAVRVGSLPAPAVEAELVVRLEYVACDAREDAACFPERVRVRVPVRLAEGGAARLAFDLALPDVPR
jgi:thiol-disulfide isomerase/thioredoxin